MRNPTKVLALGVLCVALFFSIRSAAQAAPSGTLFGLSGGGASPFQLVTVDPSTGAIVPVGGILPAATIAGGSALDAAGNRYFIPGTFVIGGGAPIHLFTVDTQTGAVLTTSPPLSARVFGFQFDPATASELLQDLINKVLAINVQQGIQNSLDVKLETTVEALDDINQNNNIVAINSLDAFINAVEAQRGIHILEADADALIDDALAIIALLGG